MCTQSTSGASIADSEMIMARVRIEGIRAIFSTGWLYLYNGITSAKKFDQPLVRECST